VTALNDPQMAAVQAAPFKMKLVTVGMSPGRSLATVIWNGLGAAPAWIAGGVVFGTTIWTVGGSAAKQVAAPVTDRTSRYRFISRSPIEAGRFRRTRRLRCVWFVEIEVLNRRL
jgi:hypothetical protein